MILKFDKLKFLHLIKKKKEVETKGIELRNYDAAKYNELLNYIFLIED